MSNLNIFQNSTKSIPESDAQIIRVNMEEIEIGGRKSILPAQHKEGKMAVSHVASATSEPGVK